MILDVTCVVALSRRTGKTYTEHAHLRVDLRFHMRDTAVVFFLPAFSLKTIEGRVGF